MDATAGEDLLFAVFGKDALLDAALIAPLSCSFFGNLVGVVSPPSEVLLGLTRAPAWPGSFEPSTVTLRDLPPSHTDTPLAEGTLVGAALLAAALAFVAFGATALLFAVLLAAALAFVAFGVTALLFAVLLLAFSLAVLLFAALPFAVLVAAEFLGIFLLASACLFCLDFTSSIFFTRGPV